MAYKGRAPKPDDERMRTNAPVFQRVPVEWDGIVRGPELPSHYPWCAYTKRWWNDFRKSPQSMVCIDSDWYFLVDTALLFDKMWANAERLSSGELKGLTTEFRVRMSAYGTTWDDRLKQRMEIRTPQSEADREAEIETKANDMIDYLEIFNETVARKKE